jgi:hypothetical protein
MKEGREKGNRVRVWWGKRRKVGGFRPKGLLLPFSPPPPRFRQRQGRGRRGSRPAPNPGKPGHGGGRAVGQNEEGIEGVLFPCLPCARAARGSGSARGWRLGGGAKGAAALWSLGEACESESASWPLIILVIMTSTI